MAAGVALTDDDRRGWLQAIAERLREARQRGSGLIVTCSALKRRYRDVLRDADPQLQLIYLHGARALVADRLAQRAGHFMPPALLGSQYDALEPPGDDEAAWTIDVSHAVDQIVARLVVLASGDATPPLARDEPA